MSDKEEWEEDWEEYERGCFRLEPWTSHVPEEKDFKAGYISARVRCNKEIEKWKSIALMQTDKWLECRDRLEHEVAMIDGAAKEEIVSLKKQLETTEAERKRYHKEFCQERQRVIDGKPSIKHEKEITRLRQQLEDLKSAEFRALEVAGCMVHEIARLKSLLEEKKNDNG